MDTLFSHVNIVTMNEQMTLWQDAFVGVTDGKIAYMAKKPPECPLDSIWRSCCTNQKD